MSATGVTTARAGVRTHHEPTGAKNDDYLYEEEREMERGCRRRARSRTGRCGGVRDRILPRNGVFYTEKYEQRQRREPGECRTGGKKRAVRTLMLCSFCRKDPNDGPRRT